MRPRGRACPDRTLRPLLPRRRPRAPLEDGTGNIAASLRPLFAALTSQKHARSARVWLSVNRHAEQLLQDIARGRAPLAHETFRDHPAPQKVAFLRRLCHEHRLLEPVNLDIERFQDWFEAKAAGLPAGDARLIRQYARWIHLNRMRDLDRRGAFKKGTFLAAKQSTTMASGFLSHLRARGTKPARVPCSWPLSQVISSHPSGRRLAFPRVLQGLPRIGAGSTSSRCV